MPHAIIHYSESLESEQIVKFIDTLHSAVLDTGVFPEGGLRIRSYPTVAEMLAKQRPFIHIEFLIGYGRNPTILQNAGRTIFHALEDISIKLFSDPLPLTSIEFIELHKTLNLKKNNLRDYISKRRQ